MRAALDAPGCRDVLTREGLGDAGRDPVRVLELESTPAAGRLAREFAAGAGLPLDEDGLAVLALLSSELVSNGVLHARTELRYEIAVTPSWVVVGLADGLPTMPSGTPHQAGRGLQLLAALAGCWGVLLGSAGKLVWFGLQRAPEAGQPLTDERAAAVRA